MYRKLRKSIATSISTFESPENFEWQKWLRNPSLDEVEIEAIDTYLEDTSKWKEPFTSPEITASEFQFESSQTFESEWEYVFIKLKTSPVFFGFKKNSAQILDYKFKKDKWRLNEGLLALENIDVKFHDKPIRSIEAKVKTPVITDHLSSLKAEVIQISLLNPKQFYDKKNKQKIYQIIFKSIKNTPKVYKVKTLSIDESSLPVYSLKKLNLPEIKIISLPFASVKDKIKYTDNLITNKKVRLPEVLYSRFLHDDNTLKEIPKVYEIDSEPQELVWTILEPFGGRELKKDEDISKYLFDFQKEGVDFLTKNKSAMLADDLGLGKTIQVVAALKTLFINSRVRNALIICKDEELGYLSQNYSESTRGWVGTLYNYAPQIPFIPVSGTVQERKIKWKTPAQVYITTFKKIFYDLEEQVIDKSTLNKIDLLIIDEVENLYSISNNSRTLFSSFKLKFLWTTTCLSPKSIIDDLNPMLKESLKIHNTLSRKISEVSDQLPPISWNEYWLDLDEDQRKEYNEQYKKSQEQVYFLLEGGNPFRFQANIFTTLHKLNQICNFPNKKNVGPKSELLLAHVKSIANSGEKVIIFSQYDNFGTKQISDLLSKNKVKALVYDPGMSTKEMGDIVNSFKKNKSITALIISVRTAKLRTELPEVKYIIYFDQWWNPASIWQTEDIIAGGDNSKKNRSLTVYTYRSKNTHEERINTALKNKGFLNKNFLDSLSVESISNFLTLEEWLNILDVKHVSNEEKISYEDKLIEFKKLPMDELQRIIKSFIIGLSYKDLLLRDGKSNDEFFIYCSLMKNNKQTNLAVLFLKQEIILVKRVEEFISRIEKTPNAGKIFILTSGRFENPNIADQKDNVSLIDGEMLIKYLVHFNLT
jgi:SNF2 family DNA or RNA helicase